MPSYIGFSTINANKPRSTNLPAGLAGGVGSMVQPVIPGKKYRLVDEALVIQDFIISLNIHQGAFSSFRALPIASTTAKKWSIGCARLRSLKLTGGCSNDCYVVALCMSCE